MTYREVDHDFVECATFADDYKYHGEGWQGDFHFIDFPWIEEGSESDYDVKESDRNLTTGINSIVDWLSGKRGDDYKTSYIYLHLMDEFSNNEDVGKSYALRLLIHYMGDLCQPFHSENRYNSEFVDGDTGANDFPLKYHYDVDELHALWDKVLYEEHNNIARPFTNETWDEFQPRVTDVMDTYAYAVANTSVYESLDYDAFAHESFDIAITLYDGVYENEAVPQAYLDKNIPIAYSQINKGGYRLFYTIKYIFEDQATSSFISDEPA